MCTVTPGRTLREASVTRPTMSAVVCAKAGNADSTRAGRATTRHRTGLTGGDSPSSRRPSPMHAAFHHGGNRSSPPGQKQVRRGFRALDGGRSRTLPMASVRTPALPGAPGPQGDGPRRTPAGPGDGAGRGVGGPGGRGGVPAAHRPRRGVDPARVRPRGCRRRATPHGQVPGGRGVRLLSSAPRRAPRRRAGHLRGSRLAYCVQRVHPVGLGRDSGDPRFRAWRTPCPGTTSVPSGSRCLRSRSPWSCWRQRGGCDDPVFVRGYSRRCSSAGAKGSVPVSVARVSGKNARAWRGATRSRIR